MMALRPAAAAALAVLATAPACARPRLTEVAPVPSTLEAAYRDAFLIGAAVNTDMVTGRDSLSAAIVREHFNSVTAENALKWESIHPERGAYSFEAADRFVAFAEANGMWPVGHVLVWHNQTPRWVFEDASGAPVSRDTLVARMREHIHTVVGRYRGRIRGWDVVNEAVDESGAVRNSPWQRIIGDDYVALAFRFAREADPDAELYYNDYSIENAPKREGALALIRRLLAEGIPVTGVGLQGHYHLDWPTVEQEDSTIRAFAGLGLKVLITELDIDVLPRVTAQPGADVTFNAALRAELDPYPRGLPDSVQQVVTRRWADLFALFLAHRGTVSRVTLWGVTDRDSWKNDWPVRGRTNYPLLFDRQGRPKRALDAVIQAAGRATPSP